MIVLSIDPGSKKCGAAVVSSDKGVLEHRVLAVTSLGGLCSELSSLYNFSHVIVGGSTGSAQVVRIVQEALACEVIVVDETHSTERARLRYFQDHPPTGLRRFLPLSLLFPPELYDDYAAVVLAEDFIASHIS
ncbi:TPA: resolvase [bacterium UBP9_UBA11836]|nr:resolvase [bacterium UBP9_UBA11836]